jgi:uncharacterized protein (TIGR00106 family)
MLLELSVSPKGKRQQVSDTAAEVSKIIDVSGLRIKGTAQGTVLEGSWEQLMAVAKKCHDAVLKKHDHITTVMRAVDSTSARSAKELQDSLEDDGEWLML